MDIELVKVLAGSLCELCITLQVYDSHMLLDGRSTGKMPTVVDGVDQLTKVHRNLPNHKGPNGRGDPRLGLAAPWSALGRMPTAYRTATLIGLRLSIEIHRI